MRTITSRVNVNIFVFAIVLALSCAATASPRCDAMFVLAGEIMEVRQSSAPFEEAEKMILDQDILFRYVARKLLERAYELPLRYTENAKQQSIEIFASAARAACLSNSK